MAEITDGTGSSRASRVDENNRLHTHSVGVSEVVHSTEKGLAYNINTGQLSITADATLLYLQNNELQDLVIEAIALGNDGGGTHSSRPFITLIRNPSGGDLITDETPVAMNQNRDFGSSNQLIADVYSGKTGGTVTGGNDIAILQSTTGGRDFFTINFVLNQGSSVAISYTANLSAGTALIYAAIICYLRDPAGEDN
jgi:hypothetical protein